MKILPIGSVGTPRPEDTPTWESLLPAPWVGLVNQVAPGTKPQDIQVRALESGKLLNSRQHLIIAGPTNSGKSLLGYFGLLQGVMAGRRGILLEPFKALAQEKFDELTALMPKLAVVTGRKPSVVITTGDYRLDGETLMSSPPAQGEIVIATPERLEAIMRIPDFDSWISSFGVCCVDEAHLLGDERRGPPLEGVLTRFLCEAAPPRLILLSATIGDPKPLLQWLKPSSIVRSEVRHPELALSLLIPEAGEAVDACLAECLSKWLTDPATGAMVFVNQVPSVMKLAQTLSRSWERRGLSLRAKGYHAQMSAAAKSSIRQEYLAGGFRCLVSTTALGAGVNLPATHVVLRDLSYAGEGPIPIADLFQMAGRAGRGSRSGEAFFLWKEEGNRAQEEFIEAMCHPQLPSVSSAMGKGARGGQAGLEGCCRLLLGLLARRDNQKLSDLTAFLGRSLGGPDLVPLAESAFSFLADSARLLAWRSPEGLVMATSLGKAVSKASLPLEVGSGFGALLRDILVVDDKDSLLAAWSPLDHLILLELLAPTRRGVRRFSKDLVADVEAWVDRSTQRSVLFRDWIRGSAATSKAEEVLGSLGLRSDSGCASSEKAWQEGYLATYRAIVILELGQGRPAPEVGRQWNAQNLDGIQERWRDNLLWLLAGLAEIFEIRCFYHHLKEEVHANDERIRRVKRLFQRMRAQTYELMGFLRHCSPLGPLFRQIELARIGVGDKTKEKLEALGIRNLRDISEKPAQDLQASGIAPNLIRRLKAYAQRRSR